MYIIESFVSVVTLKRTDKNHYPMNMAHLFATNAAVDAHNNTLYTLSKADKAQIKAVDIIVGDISDDLKKLTNEKQNPR